MASNYNITIDQGTTFVLVITYADSANAPINLTGFTARMQARAKYTSPNPPLFDVSTTIVSGTGIVLGGVAGTITVTLTATVTAALVAGQYVYDLELLSGGGIVTRLIEGRCLISPEVTK